MQALTPSSVPAGFKQSSSRLGQPALPITGLTTRIFRRPLRADITHLAIQGHLRKHGTRTDLKHMEDRRQRSRVTREGVKDNTCPCQ